MAESAIHIFVDLEVDGGCYTPAGLGLTGTPKADEIVAQIKDAAGGDIHRAITDLGLLAHPVITVTVQGATARRPGVDGAHSTAEWSET